MPDSRGSLGPCRPPAESERETCRLLLSACISLSESPRSPRTREVGPSEARSGVGLRVGCGDRSRVRQESGIRDLACLLLEYFLQSKHLTPFRLSWMVVKASTESSQGPSLGASVRSSTGPRKGDSEPRASSSHSGGLAGPGGPERGDPQPQVGGSHQSTPVTNLECL